jgi:hypothetical protein
MKEYKKTPREEGITNMITKVMMFIKDTLPGERFIVIHVDPHHGETQLSANMHPDVVEKILAEMMRQKAKVRDFLDEQGNILSDEQAKAKHSGLPDDAFLK